MKYVIVGTEGEVSEPAAIGAMLNPLRQQSPRGYARLEVVPISLKGNHGHGERLIKGFEQAVEGYIKDPDNCVEPTDEIIKMLVCDYDKMNEHGVNEKAFRRNIEATGAIPIISKPNFEYFVARSFWSEEELFEMLSRKEDLVSIISKGIKKYNKNCASEFQKLSPYSKSHFQADDWFGILFDRNPEFLRRAIEMNVDISKEYYTEIPTLIRQLVNYLRD